LFNFFFNYTKNNSHFFFFKKIGPRVVIPRIAEAIKMTRDAVEGKDLKEKESTQTLDKEKVLILNHNSYLFEPFHFNNNK